MSSSFPYRDYTVFAAGNSDSDSICKLIDEVLDSSIQAKHTFKDNRRTYSAITELNAQPIVLKIPRGRNRRKWERFLTLFRKSEGVRIFNNLELMQKLGINAPYPLFAAEKRQFGFATDSFACYVFEKGRPAGPNDAREVISALSNLHHKGYLRTDPQPANFLIAERGVIFIDFRLKKPVFLVKLKTNLELAKLFRIYPESGPFLAEGTVTSKCFKLAQWLELQVSQLRQRKRQLKISMKEALQRDR